MKNFLLIFCLVSFSLLSNQANARPIGQQMNPIQDGWVGGVVPADVDLGCVKEILVSADGNTKIVCRDTKDIGFNVNSVEAFNFTEDSGDPALILGAKSATFPGIFRSTTDLEFKLGDGSIPTNISAANITAFGNLNAQLTTPDTNSPNLSLLGNSTSGGGSGEIEGSLFLAYGAQPYLVFSVDDTHATPVLTQVAHLDDNSLRPASAGGIALGSTSNYFSNTISTQFEVPASSILTASSDGWWFWDVTGGAGNDAAWDFGSNDDHITLFDGDGSSAQGLVVTGDLVPDGATIYDNAPTTDVAPDDFLTHSAHNYSQGTQDASDLILFGGLDEKLLTVDDRAESSDNDIITITVNGSDTTITADTDFVCSGAASEAACACNLYDYVIANPITGLTPGRTDGTCSDAVVFFQPSDGVAYKLDSAITDGGGLTAFATSSNGTDGNLLVSNVNLNQEFKLLIDTDKDTYIWANNLDDVISFVTGTTEKLALGSTAFFRVSPLLNTGIGLKWQSGPHIFADGAMKIRFDDVAATFDFTLDYSASDSYVTLFDGDGTSAQSLEQTGPPIYTPSANTDYADASAITATNPIMLVASDGAATKTLTSTPSIVAGVKHGTCVRLMGFDDTDPLTIQDDDVLAGSTLELAGSIFFEIGLGDMIELCWNATTSKWYELSRSDN